MNSKRMPIVFLFMFLSLFLLFFFSNEKIFAQTSHYVSAPDESLNIKAIQIYPFFDNVSDIYSKPLRDEIIRIIENQKQWWISDVNLEKKISPEDLENDPILVKKILSLTNSEALLTGRIVKGEKGISIRLVLFVGKDGLPLSYENLTNFSGFDLEQIKYQEGLLFEKLKSKLPYEGIVVGRKENLVTVNLGSQNGLKVGDQLLALQVVKINRHPKFNFATNYQKEIFGKITLNKVEKYLSFGSVETEREANAIIPPFKVITSKFVSHAVTPLEESGKLADNITEKLDSQLFLGENSKEWKPPPQPGFGKTSLQFAITQFQINNLLTGIGAVNGSNSLTPSLFFDTELWITQFWFGSFHIKEYLTSVSNSYPYSSPTKLNVHTQDLGGNLGYNFLLNDDFWGPKIQLSGGFSMTKTIVEASNPLAYNNTTYSGLSLGIKGSFPFSLKPMLFNPLTLGAYFNYYLFPSVSESPTSSGSPSNASSGQFGIFSTYTYKYNLNLLGEISWASHSTSFSGSGSRPTPASSSSLSLMSLGLGLEFLY